MEKSGNLLKHIFKSFSEFPENVPETHFRFFFVGVYTFLVGFLFHFAFIFIFYLISIKELALLNIGSSFIWIVILSSHLRGNFLITAPLALFEINLHAIMCVIYIGWGTGFQYYILSLPMLFYFAPSLQKGMKPLLMLTSFFIFGGLHFFLSDTPPIYLLEPWIRNIFYYGNLFSIFFILSLASYYYNSAATSAEEALVKEKRKLEEMTTLLKRMFGRYLSTEVMNSLIDNPSALELGGEKRRVTILMSDLRGFTALSERLTPEKVVQMLNNYFEIMVEIVLKYNGTINEIIGDALLIIFGAPQKMPDRAQKAIACAIEMQNAMSQVNSQNRSLGLPELEMGIGLNESEVIVGNIGSVKRSKYTAVGSGVNMTSRIESYTVGGQILVSESVYREARDILRVDSQRDVLPKGADTAMKIYEIGGISGQYNLSLNKKDPEFVTLEDKIPIDCSLLEEKDVANKGIKAFLIRLSPNCAELITDARFEVMSNMKMNLVETNEKLSKKDFYGKIIQTPVKKGNPHVIRFTSMPPELDAYFHALLKYNVRLEKASVTSR